MHVMESLESCALLLQNPYMLQFLYNLIVIIHFCLFFISVPPSYTLSSSYLSLFNGSSRCINISIQALPYPFNYSWTHDTEFLAVVPPTHLMMTAHSICFNPVLQSDNGTYTVISTNKAGNGSISFNLNVFCKLVYIYKNWFHFNNNCRRPNVFGRQ